MKIGRYEILGEIGRGAMGTVYQARDPLIERTVAIKAVPITQLQQEGTEAESRFMREAKSAGRLSHPNIVTIYDVGEADGLAYIAMEFLSGTTLRDLMDTGPIPLELALDTTLQMAQALAFAHDHGVIHRDIKPANVIVTDQHGRIKLTDFGIAHLANSEHTHAGRMLGSPRYMSPEQAMGREIDGRSDIFSLGAVLYEMLTGHYAFDGDSLPTIVYRVVNDTPATVASLRPQVPARLSSLVADMLNKNPQARPDARTLVDALHELTRTEPPDPEPSPAPTTPTKRRSPMLAIGLSAGAVLLAGLGIITWERSTETHPESAGPASIQQAATPALSMPLPMPVEALPPQAPLADSVPPPEQVPPPPAPAQPDPYLTGLDKKRAELRLRRTELLLEYTERHPDVVQIDRQLEQLRIERRQYLQQRKNEAR
ncbi:MAG TPA: serine/threonine-protein kinase [Thiobacillaceae bacterium]|nr:serine/threonine-protein kinase [Thiobacillaceae bacterium]